MFELLYFLFMMFNSEFQMCLNFIAVRRLQSCFQLCQTVSDFQKFIA